MARETDLILKGASKASRTDNLLEEGGQLNHRDPFIAPWQQAEKPGEETILEKCQETYNKLFEFVKGVMKAARAENSFSLEQGCTQIPLLTKAQATYWSTIPSMSLYVALRSVRHWDMIDVSSWNWA
jgi:hypothetical protein